MIVCARTECMNPSDVGGYCAEHKRRRGPERQEPWERLVMAAIDFADAAPGRPYDNAAENLKRAAEAYQRQRKSPHAGRRAA